MPIRLRTILFEADLTGVELTGPWIDTVTRRRRHQSRIEQHQTSFLYIGKNLVRYTTIRQCTGVQITKLINFA